MSLSNLDLENETIYNSNKMQANKLLDAYAKQDNLSHLLKTKYLQSDIQNSKILGQEKDLISMSKNLDDRIKTQSILKEKLDQKTSDAYQLAEEKNTLFNNIEQIKFDSHNTIVEMQSKFNDILNNKNEKMANWMSK
jgi:hypothetical protein